MTIMYSMPLDKLRNALILASLLGVGAALVAPAPAHAASPGSPAMTNLSVTAMMTADCTI
jgi:hypothetical protein